MGALYCKEKLMPRHCGVSVCLLLLFVVCGLCCHQNKLCPLVYGTHSDYCNIYATSVLEVEFYDV